MTKDEAERAKRLEKLQSTLHAVQMPQADQQLVGVNPTLVSLAAK
jgi:hypothetical protein